MSSPKKQAQICHKIAALAFLLGEALDELNPEMKNEHSLKARCNEMSEACQLLVKNTFAIEEIYTGSYMQELATKVDTCIRKNYVRIPGTEE